MERSNNIIFEINHWRQISKPKSQVGVTEITVAMLHQFVATVKIKLKLLHLLLDLPLCLHDLFLKFQNIFSALCSMSTSAVFRVCLMLIVLIFLILIYVGKNGN